MTALRCTMCGVSWPPTKDYKKCPQCLEPTDIVGNIKPSVSDEEARSIKNHADFERFYDEEWPKVSVDNSSP